MSINLSSHVLLAVLLIAWSYVHSAMISTTGIRIAKRLLGRRFYFYRLIYNFIALITLAPILVYSHFIPARMLWQWGGGWFIVQIILWAAGLYLLLAGAKNYDGQQFLGIRQWRTGKRGLGLGASGELNTQGILQVTRHPWYLAGLLLLWARSVDSVALVLNGVFSAYLIFGAFLEEKKLVREYGEQYRAYRARVSMFLPVKWLMGKLQR